VTSVFTEWPEEVAFSGPELDLILEALDYAVDLTPRASQSLQVVRRAQVVIWRKLWPELADQYDDADPQGEE
jgi:hypothetical protein